MKDLDPNLVFWIGYFTAWAGVGLAFGLWRWLEWATTTPKAEVQSNET